MTYLITDNETIGNTSLAGLLGKEQQMTKETRLYAQITLDFADSAKIKPLSDKAFRQFIEALLWSRRMLTDGLIPTKMIPILFVPEVLEELTTNDVSSPTLRVIDGGVMIHDFAEHQMTRAKIDEKRISGSKGGRAKAANSSSKNVAPATTLVEQNSTEPLASTEYRVQSTTTSKEVVSKARATRLPEPFEVTDAMREWAAEKHSNVDLVTATDNFVDYWRSKPTGATKLDWVATWRTWIRNTKPISQSRTFQTSADAKLDRNRQARANVEAMFTQQQAITENPDWA